MTDKKAQSIERAIEVAAIAYARHRLEEVSINWIAEESHCSTATLYDVFGSKEGLYRAAAARLLERIPTPRMQSFEGKPHLYPLLDYSEQRLRFIAGPERSRADQLLIGRIDVAGEVLRDRVEREVAYMDASIGQEVERCVAMGAMRDVDRASLIYCISACTAHQPMTVGLYYRGRFEMDVAEVLRKSFLPLVTEKGAIQLEAYISERIPAGADTGGSWGPVG